MKNIPRAFILLAGPFLALIPAAQVAGQPVSSTKSLIRKDTMTLWEARRKLAESIMRQDPKHSHMTIDPNSLRFTLDSFDFDAVCDKKHEHFTVDLKTLGPVRTPHHSNGDWRLKNEAGKDLPGPLGRLVFTYQGWDGFWQFADALNGLRIFAGEAGNPLRNFAQQAAAWRALSAKPSLAENARILRLAAEDAIKRQKPDEALNDFELGVQADPTWAQGWFNAALLAGELGFYNDAVEHMQNYLELMPNASDAQSARDQIDLWKYKAGQ